MISSRLECRLNGLAGLLGREQLAVNNCVRLPVGGKLSDLCMELPQEVRAAVLVDDLADDSMAPITTPGPLHAPIDR